MPDLPHRERRRGSAEAIRRLERKLVAESIGTFLLVLTVCLATARTGAGPLAPLAIGSVLMALVFAGGHISGAHYNPVVTIAVLASRRMPRAEAASYVVVQLVAAAAAAGLARGLVGPQASAATGEAWKILVVELVFSATLAYVVLNVAVSSATSGNSFYGLAIGFTVAAGALAAGGISGGAFNPAVAIGVCISGGFAWSHLWIYALAGIAGGCLAAATSSFLLFDDATPGG